MRTLLKLYNAYLGIYIPNKLQSITNILEMHIISISVRSFDQHTFFYNIAIVVNTSAAPNNIVIVG